MDITPDTLFVAADALRAASAVVQDSAPTTPPLT
jgi:hypothetical protein